MGGIAMVQYQHVPGRTIEVELHFQDRALLLQAVRAYIDGATRCQGCGRPEDDKRDKNKELAILDRLQKLVDRRVVEEFGESVELELSSAQDDFIKAFETAKTCGKFCHYTGTGRDVPYAYKDATGVLIKRPKITPEMERGVDKGIELYKSLAVAFPMGLYAFCKVALEGMNLWNSWSAEYATALNAKFGVALLAPDLEPIHVAEPKPKQ
jgi:hypothetical protein